MRGFNARSLRPSWAVAALATVALVAAACDKETTAPVKVATSNVTTSVTSSTVAVAAGKTFSLPSGAALSPALANQPVSLTFNTAGTSTTAAITTPGGTVNTTVTFGSCIFTVQAPGLPPNFVTGQVITVATCSITLNTANVPANGTTQNVPMTLNLGGTTSVPVTVPVVVSPTGTVTANTPTGTPITVGTTTTATGTGT